MRQYTFRTVPQVRYILQNYEDMSNREIGRRIGLTAEQVRNVLRIRGIAKAKSRGFRRGCIPHNKGRRMAPDTYEKVSRTMFKPGNLPATAKPPGTVRQTKDGPYVKADHRRRWISIRRWVWQQHHGPIPTGHVVILLPGGDPNNPAPEYLRAVTRAELVRMNSAEK